MFQYYLDLALRSLRRNKALTALMVFAVALGIGASMTTLTVFHVLSGDPIPGSSGTLFYPQLDPQDKDGYEPGKEPPDQVTWIDGMNLLKAHRGTRQALMTGGAVPVQPAQSGLDPFFSDARYTTADFFAMFKAPFLYGHGWNAADDDAKARVVVITRELNDKLFGGKDSTGQTLRMDDVAFRIVGVLDSWRPTPHFYDLNTGSYSSNEGVFVPLTTATDLLRWTRSHRRDDGSYWTGIVYPQEVRFPFDEHTSYTAAAVILAADAITGASPAAHVFTAAELFHD